MTYSSNLSSSIHSHNALMYTSERSEQNSLDLSSLHIEFMLPTFHTTKSSSVSTTTSGSEVRDVSASKKGHVNNKGIIANSIRKSNLSVGSSISRNSDNIDWHEMSFLL